MPIHTEMLRLTSSDSFTFDAYHVHPDGPAKGRLVVLQEIFGVNDHIRAVCDAYAALGYDVIAPALFDRVRANVNLGYDPDSLAEGRALMTGLDLGNALLDATAAVDRLGGPGEVAVIGYCWGGSLAWLLATQLPLRAAICYYGSQIGKHLDKALLAPALLHFGDADTSIPVSVADDVRRAQPAAITHVYTAGHGFNCSARAAYVPAAAELALARSLGLLGAVF